MLISLHVSSVLFSEGGISVNINKLLDVFSVLRGRIIVGAVLSPGELSDRCLPLFLCLADGIKIDFVESLGQSNIPDDWQTCAKDREIAFEVLSKETINAARQGLRIRIRNCRWTLSTPPDLREQLLEQGVENIKRVEDFLTVAFRWQMNIDDLRFHVLCVQAIPLTTVLTDGWVRRIFTQCKD